MIWPITIICSLVGSMLFSVPGAFLGLLVGVLIDRQLNLPSWKAMWLRMRGKGATGKPPVEHLHFMLLGYLAKLNGRVLPIHIKQTGLEMQRQQLNGYAQQAAINAFNQGKHMQLATLRALLEGGALKTGQAEMIIASCWRLVWAERKVSQSQRQAIFSCGKWLGLAQGRIAALELPAKPASSQTVGGNSSEITAALAILGLPSAVRDWNRIQQTYRRLLSENHPDKLIGQGASANKIEQANKKTQQLHKAYSVLRKRLQN